MIVLSLYGVRKNKFKLILAAVIIVAALTLLLISVVGQRPTVEVLSAENPGEAGEDAPSRGESYPGEPVRVLSGAGEEAAGPEGYWSAVLQAVSD